MNDRRRATLMRRLYRLRRRYRHAEYVRARHSGVVASWVSRVVGQDASKMTDAELVKALHGRIDDLLVLDGTIAEPLSDLGALAIVWAAVTVARGKFDLLERRIRSLERRLHGA